MNSGIISSQGKVYFVMKAGRHYVQNTMPLFSAQHIVENGRRVVDRQVDALAGAWYRCVDDSFFFPIHPPVDAAPGADKVTRRKGGGK